MGKNQLKKPYDPHLDPERRVLDAKKAILDEIRGISRIVRAGQQYFMSCVCGALEITDDDNMEVTKFRADHSH